MGFCYNTKTNLKQLAEIDKSDWIVIPNKENNNFVEGSRAFIHSQGRVPYNNATKKIEKELGFKIYASKDSLERWFASNLDWGQAGMLNQALGVRTPWSKEEADYMLALHLASQGQLQLYDNSGKPVDSKLCKKLFDDKAKRFDDRARTQSPLRGSWLDDDIKINDNKFEVHYNNIFDMLRNVVNYKSDVLDKDTLLENKQIDFVDYIIRNHTSQGLISKYVKFGDFHFSSIKRDNFVLRFGAFDDSTGLFFDNPFFHYNSHIGVESVAD